MAQTQTTTRIDELQLVTHPSNAPRLRGRRSLALKKAVIPENRDSGMHALRHRFASVLLDGGVSIREVAEWLGHSDPGFTLRTYTHLMKQGEDRMRLAVDQTLRGASVDGQVLANAPDVRQQEG